MQMLCRRTAFLRAYYNNRDYNMAIFEGRPNDFRIRKQALSQGFELTRFRVLRSRSAQAPY